MSYGHVLAEEQLKHTGGKTLLKAHDEVMNMRDPFGWQQDLVECYKDLKQRDKKNNPDYKAEQQKQKLAGGLVTKTTAKKAPWADWTKLLAKPMNKNDIVEDVGPIEDRLDRYKGIYAKMGSEHLNYPLNTVKEEEKYFNEDYYAVVGDKELQKEIADPEYRRPLPASARSHHSTNSQESHKSVAKNDQDS